jgi:sugar phosphate permease
MGLSTLGTSLGGFIFPVLLASAAAAFGWREAAAMVGLAAALLVALIVWITVIDTPQQIGLEPDEGRPTRKTEVTGDALSAAMILRRPAFWIITLGVGLKIATYFALINNLAGYGRALGWTKFAPQPWYPCCR